MSRDVLRVAMSRGDGGDTMAEPALRGPRRALGWRSQAQQLGRQHLFSSPPSLTPPSLLLLSSPPPPPSVEAKILQALIKAVITSCSILLVLAVIAVLICYYRYRKTGMHPFAAEIRIPLLRRKKLDVGERLRATCAIGGLRKTGPPVLMGSGFCIDGSRRIFCSCAHVWNAIQAETPLATAAYAKWAKDQADLAAALATASGMEAAQKEAEAAQKEAEMAAKKAVSSQDGPMAILDPFKHGVMIGFQPTDKQRAEDGEIDWVGRAVLLDPPGLIAPPRTPFSPNAPKDGLDLVIVQLTQQLDGKPLASLVPLVALPLGRADTLITRDPLTMLGFGVPRLKPGFGVPEHRPGNMRPKYPTFSTIALHGDSGRWIEMDGANMYGGHSGGPTLGPRGDVVGWNVRTAGVDQLRPVDVRFEQALTEALNGLDPSTAAVPLRERLEVGNLTLPLHDTGSTTSVF